MTVLGLAFLLSVVGAPRIAGAADAADAAVVRLAGPIARGELEVGVRDGTLVLRILRDGVLGGDDGWAALYEVKRAVLADPRQQARVEIALGHPTDASACARGAELARNYLFEKQHAPSDRIVIVATCADDPVPVATP